MKEFPLEIRSYRDLHDLVEQLTDQCARLRRENQMLYERDLSTSRNLERERKLVAEYRERALTAERLHEAPTRSIFGGVKGPDGKLLSQRDIDELSNR